MGTSAIAAASAGSAGEEDDALQACTSRAIGSRHIATFDWVMAYLDGE